MKRANGSRLFPPPIGWIPFTIAIVAATIVATVAFVPTFINRPVVSAPGTQAASGLVGGTEGSAGTAGSTGAATTVQNSGGGGTTTGGSSGPAAAANCAGGHNAGATAPGVSATAIHIATTDVTTGVGAGFLGEATDGMQAAINEANSTGGICGRRVVLDPPVNSGWDSTAGQNAIQSFIQSGNVFALVGEPDSEGLAGAIGSDTIDKAQIPVVGTDGMLSDQYQDPWVWPVAASTVTNMHIAASYAVKTLHARSFGIVYDERYKFGAEGANAFDQEIKRLTGQDIPGYSPSGCNGRYCGISSDQTGGYSSAITTFDNGCKPCDVVVMLLEPQPMANWMKGEENANSWYTTLMGGEPLFDDNFAGTCAQDCAKMAVWTGYHPAIQPFDAEAPVSKYSQSLKGACPSCDPHNEFTEGAYLGTKLFLEACRRVGSNLTRAALRDALNSGSFDLGLSSALHYTAALPHLANTSMTAFADNAQGSFNGWNYLSTGFLPDPASGQDLRNQ